MQDNAHSHNTFLHSFVFSPRTFSTLCTMGLNPLMEASLAQHNKSCRIDANMHTFSSLFHKENSRVHFHHQCTSKTSKTKARAGRTERAEYTVLLCVGLGTPRSANTATLFRSKVAQIHTFFFYPISVTCGRVSGFELGVRSPGGFGDLLWHHRRSLQLCGNDKE